MENHLRRKIKDTILEEDVRMVAVVREKDLVEETQTDVEQIQTEVLVAQEDLAEEELEEDLNNKFLAISF